MTKIVSQSAFESIVKDHGHRFHSRVVRKLRELNWTVVVSPYYSDNFTDKPREIDIVAEKLFPYRNQVRGTDHNVEVSLFVECKYVAQPTVIWFDDKDRQKAVERVQADGFNSPVLKDDFQHHYLPARPVGKLFASHKKGEENDPFGRAINQNLNALIYYRPRTSVGLQSQAGTIGRLCYPIIVVNSFDNLHQTTFGDDEGTAPVEHPFQLEVNYAYVTNDGKPSSEYFLIDVVTVDLLDRFLNDLKEKDVNSRWAHWVRQQQR